ncbi:hypothetical protein NC653_032520 [Populus alba x Populus x berolinensis]|uniref:Uncharacterized protein n=1 Tax=Populus alba x Populus x berolinensis TaxID=444605 RepID=A0AAD6LRI8_9ROSI|nr:hypothetical protein NC653_032520 [Populus alba x Populus x berolinensis]
MNRLSVHCNLNCPHKIFLQSCIRFSQQHVKRMAKVDKESRWEKTLQVEEVGPLFKVRLGVVSTILLSPFSHACLKQELQQAANVCAAEFASVCRMPLSVLPNSTAALVLVSLPP